MNRLPVSSDVPYTDARLRRLAEAITDYNFEAAERLCEDGLKCVPESERAAKAEWIRQKLAEIRRIRGL